MPLPQTLEAFRTSAIQESLLFHNPGELLRMQLPQCLSFPELLEMEGILLWLIIQPPRDSAL